MDSFETLMEVDNKEEKELICEREGSEEGELTDEDLPPAPLERPQKPQKPFEITKEERLGDRTRRLGSDTSLSENELKKLYRSVGASEDKDGKKFRFDSIKMHGTEAMSTQDIFDYFKDYAPVSIEWINDESCNVVWTDNLSAIRALLGLSKPIKNIIEQRKKYKEGTNVSNGVKNNPLKVEGEEGDLIVVEDDKSKSKSDEEIEKELSEDSEAVDALELNMLIPPGRWRKGRTHPNSDGILLQFSSQKEESFNTVTSKRLPQPVFGMMGLVSKSRKQRMKEGLIVRPKISQDDMGDDRDFIVISDEEDSRNPWGNLAKSWSNIDRARRPPRPYEYDELGRSVPPPPPMMFPPSPLELMPEMPPSPPPVAVSLGSARIDPRNKRRKQIDSDSEEEDEESWTTRSKIPRMRMYADEEEIKVTERKILQASRDNQKRRDFKRVKPDLRDRLGNINGHHSVDYSDRRGDRTALYSDRRRNKLRSPPLRHKIQSVASSVWCRLAENNSVKLKRESDSESEYSSDPQTPDCSDESCEEDSNLPALAVRSNIERKDFDEYEDEDEINERQRIAAASKIGIDLRSKLNKKKGGTTINSVVPDIIAQKSPLRIEIDNDEYYGE